MLNRRNLLKLASAAAVTASYPTGLALADVKRIVFVHGRAQEGLDPVKIKEAWLKALGNGANGRAIPAAVEVSFPYYGDKLAEFAAQMGLPLASDIHTRGGPTQQEFLAFQSEVAQEIRKGAGVSDAEVDAEYGDNPKPRGPLNWEWVQAILRALDRHGGGMSRGALELFTRDVFLYSTRPAVRKAIDDIVAAQLTEEPTVVVGHSLGSVVAYSVLRSDKRQLKVPLFVTVGCPLGIRPIRDQFLPLKWPGPVTTWNNAYDKRDVVALYPLDATNFAVSPPVTNFDSVNNHTDNRHGIDGYLGDATVADWILKALGG
jgi:hypothetical protein